MSRSLVKIALSVALPAVMPFMASAQFRTFYNFPATSGQPVGAPVLVNGTIYGVSYSGWGGSPLCTTGKACGTFFQLVKPASHGDPWGETVLYQFKGGADGAGPDANPIYLNNNFYGTTLGGGIGQGTAYVMVPDGNGGFTHTVIYTFLGGTADGSRPTYLAVLNNNIYGIAAGGANGAGVVFQLTGSGTSWTESIIHNFNGPTEGSDPQYIVAFNGKLYISLATAGSGNGGTIMQLTPPSSGTTWGTNIIYAFGSTGDSGYNPEGFIFNETEGNIYGVTQVGGGGACSFKTFTGCGAVYKLTDQNRPITWKFQQLYEFAGGADGDAPFAPPAFDAAGNLWVTSTGIATSPSSSGAVVELTHPPLMSWQGTVFHTFTGTDGDDPGGQLILNTSNGIMYGFTVHGGTGGNGVAYSVVTTPQ